MPRKAPSAGALRIEIVSQRLRGGRLNISARTHSARERDAREQALRALLARDPGGVERLRKGELRIEDVQRAFATGDWAALAVAPAEAAVTSEALLGAELDSYIRSVEATARAAETAEAYRVKARVVLESFPATTPMRLVTIAQAEAFLHAPKGRRGQVWAPSTQHGYASFLASLWDRVIVREADAADAEGREPRLTRNPWKRRKQGGIRLPRKTKTRVAWLREPDWRRLSAATAGTPRRALFAFGVLAGLREMEVANLRRMDVDLGARLIHVRERDGERPWMPKTERGTREVPMALELVEIVAEHIRLGFAGEKFVLHAARWKAERPLAATTIITWTRQSLTALGLAYGRADREALTYHSFRHTFASWLLQGNVRADGSIDAVDVVRVAELLGEKVETVLDTYAHLIPHNLRDAVGVLDRKLVQP